MNDFILEEMNKYNADGVDFVSITFNSLQNPNIYKTYTRKEWLASDRSYPKTNRRYWKIIDGKKTYIDTFSFKVLENIIKDTADTSDIKEAQEVADEM